MLAFRRAMRDQVVAESMPRGPIDVDDVGIGRQPGCVGDEGSPGPAECGCPTGTECASDKLTDSPAAPHHAAPQHGDDDAEVDEDVKDDWWCRPEPAAPGAYLKQLVLTQYRDEDDNDCRRSERPRDVDGGPLAGQQHERKREHRPPGGQDDHRPVHGFANTPRGPRLSLPRIARQRCSARLPPPYTPHGMVQARFMTAVAPP